jgi:hypothetical protein
MKLASMLTFRYLEKNLFLNLFIDSQIFHQPCKDSLGHSGQDGKHDSQ